MDPFRGVIKRVTVVLAYLKSLTLSQVRKKNPIFLAIIEFIYHWSICLAFMKGLLTKQEGEEKYLLSK